MRLASIMLLAGSICLFSQSFDATMPPAVPAVSGAVVSGPGIHYIEMELGNGELAIGGKAFTVNYTGWLRNGKQFDSSVGKDPLKFIQGRRQVIPGFDIAFEGMKVGGKRRVFIPYQLAYGEAGKGPIPPRSELIFDVELLQVGEPRVQPPAGDLMLSFDMMSQQVMDLAKAVPEEKYDWRPSKDVRSFREVFLHIGYAIHLQLMIANGAGADEVKKQIEVQRKGQKEPLSKDEVLKKLAQRFDEARSAFSNALAPSLGREVDFFGNQTTQRGVFGFVNTHIAEHLGQAIAYARMNGIVPPWSAN